MVCCPVTENSALLLFTDKQQHIAGQLAEREEERGGIGFL